VNELPSAAHVACVALGGAHFRYAIRTKPLRGGAVRLLDDIGVWTDALLPAAGDLVVSGEPRDMEGAPFGHAGLDRRARADIVAGRSDHAGAWDNHPDAAHGDDRFWLGCDPSTPTTPCYSYWRYFAARPGRLWFHN